MFDQFNSIPIDKLIIISISGVNLLATVYIHFNPRLESKLFDLYTGSVIGLYSGRVLQQRSESNDSNKDSNKDAL